MKISKILPKKTANSIIALILILTMTLSISAYLPATAQSATFPVYAYVNFAPNPIGIGQTGICLFFLDRPSPIATAYF